MGTMSHGIVIGTTPLQSADARSGPRGTLRFSVPHAPRRVAHRGFDLLLHPSGSRRDQKMCVGFDSFQPSISSMVRTLTLW